QGLDEGGIVIDHEHAHLGLVRHTIILGGRRGSVASLERATEPRTDDERSASATVACASSSSSSATSTSTCARFEPALLALGRDRWRGRPIGALPRRPGLLVQVGV